MNGLVAGLVLGVGLVLLVSAFTSPPRARRRSRGRARLDDLLASAGLAGLGAGRLVGASAASGLVTLVVVLGGSRSVVLAVAFAVGATAAPTAAVRWRAERRRGELRAVWPDVVDDLASGVRAGLSLPEALARAGARAPASVAPAFERFAADHRASGRFGASLDALKERLADPVADRIVESLRLAREVGGSDLGRLLRDLSTFLREDARTRGELEARQGWTVNAARLAAAAPWLTLALLSLRPEAVHAYDTPQGAFVLLAGAAVTVVAYRAMVRIGRLPTEPRVLR